MSADNLQFDPTIRDTIDNPFPLFARLQKEAPVHWSDQARGWVVTRFEDCKTILLDKRFSSERMKPFFESLGEEPRQRLKNLESSVGLWAVFLDPPDHTRLRGLLNRSFTSRAVNEMAPNIAEIVHDLIDTVSGRSQIDFVRDVAYRIPAAVIMEMLGAPRSEIENFKIWSDDLGLFVGSSRVTPDKYQRAEAAVIQMSNAFRDLIAERRRKPRADLITNLIRAEDHGKVLGEQELIATCILLLFAGHETTGNMLATGMYYFMKNPDQWQALREHPQRVFAMINAANRDPDMFDDPQRFDIRRRVSTGAALGQFAFGHGIHFCIGAPLARLEGRIALPIFAERMLNPKMIGGEPHWFDSLSFRGLTELPMSCDFAPGKDA